MMISWALQVGQKKREIKEVTEIYSHFTGRRFGHLDYVVTKANCYLIYDSRYTFRTLVVVEQILRSAWHWVERP